MKYRQRKWSAHMWEEGMVPNLKFITIINMQVNHRQLANEKKGRSDEDNVHWNIQK